MFQVCSAFLLLLLGLPLTQTDEAKPSPPGTQGPPLSVNGLLKQFDRNGDGQLSKEESPPPVVKIFSQVDQNKDGKLTRAELEQAVRLLQAGGLRRPEPALVLKKIMLLDGDGDGKISKTEARGRIAENFPLLDTNKDGFLDSDEIQRLVQRLVQGAGQGGPPGQPSAARDFDALDGDANGRLTRQELKNSVLLKHFNQIDTNRDGVIDRGELERYLEKAEAERQKAPRSAPKK